jgi:hypothetical protein
MTGFLFRALSFQDVPLLLPAPFFARPHRPAADTLVGMVNIAMLQQQPF